MVMFPSRETEGHVAYRVKVVWRPGFRVARFELFEALARREDEVEL